MSGDNFDQAGIDARDTHLAFRIGIDWYVSDQGFLHQGDSNTWLTNMVNLSDLTFTLNDNGMLPYDGSTLPNFSDPRLSGLTLPVGEVNAFGLWWDGPKTGTDRVDNFKLIGIPEPGTIALLGLGLAGMGMHRKKKA